MHGFFSRLRVQKFRWKKHCNIQAQENDSTNVRKMRLTMDLPGALQLISATRGCGAIAPKTPSRFFVLDADPSSQYALEYSLFWMRTVSGLQIHDTLTE